ncbi:hypothetical protein [Alteromonas halophila]|uniref:Lipoprotein n=1 Tax=Alteromonas halophila TaxID=516698 RepID=A0A918JIT1_9ALTE|nr:hypothetical protein [Alteromonas halophila]GGW81480.1 hypothetical protein GCM10007391_13330 [Alteromonas halophila]
MNEVMTSAGKWRRLVALLFVSFSLLISGCKSTSNQTNVTRVGPSMTGPASSKALGNANRSYNYTSDIYLDVAVPVFDPGIPQDEYGNIDDEAVVEQDIWPQVRRLEANRFALATKEALGDTQSFGKINVTPNANVSADVYVLGKINYSDTETVKIGIRVMDATNTMWGEEEFEYRVSQGFYRDAMRKGNNPYEPVFKQIAGYVYDLLKLRSEQDKQNIERVSDVRYAAMYSPEKYAHYLTEEKSGFFSKDAAIGLNGAPSEDDPMYQRIQAIKARDMQFIDELQDSYETFGATTHDAYRKYQRETLPVAARIRKEKEKRTKAQVATAALGIAAIMLGKNSGSTAGQVAAAAAGVGAAYSLSEAIQSNRELGAQRKLLDEMGQNLDIQATDQVVEFNDQTIELQGTAAEQYAQLRQRLYEIYEMEATPDTQL